MAQIPGSVARHRIITPRCRERSFDDVVDEVLGDVEEELNALDEGWSRSSRVQFHVVVTVERPFGPDG